MCILDIFFHKSEIEANSPESQSRQVHEKTAFQPVVPCLNLSKMNTQQMRLHTANMHIQTHYKTLQTNSSSSLDKRKLLYQIVKLKKIFHFKGVIWIDRLFKVSIRYRSISISLQYNIGDFQLKGFKLGLYYLRHLLSLTLEKEVNNCVLLW